MSKSYLDRKEAWAQKMAGSSDSFRKERSEDRLPPGQHTVEKLPVLDLGIQPNIEEKDWVLESGGEVENEIKFDWESLMQCDHVEETSDFHCVTTWSKYDCKWGGVRMLELLDKVRPHSDAEHVLFVSYDGYTTNVPIEAVYSEYTLLVTSLNGEPLSKKHGGPVRVVIPHLYAWKSAKFVKQIQFTNKMQLGYWEKRGYSNTADPWREERFIDEEVPGWRD
ncbi:MAG: sulfite oxidase-like oxidoreductase [Verrucomicrobiota bacterium]|nr:sulfite oxidase-like oxidoreductase [Verrucomicrobiota bacterium]